MAKEGSRITIHLDGFHIPYVTPPLPKKEDIDGWDLPKKEQKWKRPIFPTDKEVKEYTKQERTNLIEKDFRRRLFGYWFMNNGEPTYITGDYYFYLTHWFMGAMTDDGYPEYRMANRNWMYVVDLCEKSTTCFGAIMMCQKRDGKALFVDTDIPTPNGWKKMIDLQVGDFVFGHDGKQTKVIFTSEIQFNRDCYKIVFSDGTSVVADGEHRWVASSVSDRAYRLNRKSTERTIRERIVTTNDIYKSVLTKGGTSNWSIENCAPIEYSAKQLPIPPYIFGMWIGDGNSDYATLTSVDDELVRKWFEYGESINLIPKTRNIAHSLLSNGKENSFVIKIKEIGVYKNKHIPNIYLQSSVSDRIELLRGLMDTDGTCDISKKRNALSFCNKNKQVIVGVGELLSSLGIKSTIRECFHKKDDKPTYYINFLSYNLDVFTLKRKLDKINKLTIKNSPSKRRFITNVQKVDSVPVKCIQVDNESHTYLCTKSFLTTHNTERHLSILYNRATLIDENSLFGLQSLTATEAKNNLFKGRLMRSHKRIQNYLKPVSNETNSSREIVSELTFMGENLGGGEYKDALNNVIDWRPTIASAYQGKKPREIFIDEPGSIEEMDLIEWWTTVREQLALGKKIYGKAFLPTTLEDMKKRGAESFKKIWYDSDPEETDENGRTKSGLWRYFKPFYSGREGFIDEYGNDLADEAKRFRQNTLDSARDADKRKIKRQYPETVEEAFDVIVGSIWEDDVKEILKDANELSETVFIRAVTLYEVDGVVKTRPANKGDDTAVNILEEPRKNTKISLGIDSASTDDETGSDGGSKIAAVATCGFGEMNAQFSPVMSLSERPMNKESVYHKIYLMAKYIIDAGAELEIVGEINGGGTDCFHYLCNKGLKKYMTGTPKEYSNVDSGDKNGKYWVYVNGDVLYFLHGLGNRFIRQNGSNFRLRSVIKSLLSYGLQNEDEASAFLISLINFRNFDKPVPKKKDPKPKKRTQFNPSTMMWEDVPI